MLHVYAHNSFSYKFTWWCYDECITLILWLHDEHSLNYLVIHNRRYYTISPLHMLGFSLNLDYSLSEPLNTHELCDVTNGQVGYCPLNRSSVSGSAAPGYRSMTGPGAPVRSGGRPGRPVARSIQWSCSTWGVLVRTPRAHRNRGFYSGGKAQGRHLAADASKLRTEGDSLFPLATISWAQLPASLSKR